MSRVYDVCVIGSGAAGSILSKVLCDKGAEVAIIEQGDIISPGTHLKSVMENSEKAYARNLNGSLRLNGYPWTAIAVGGGTVFYGGVSFRYRDVDFNARNYVVQDALDPMWPIAYSDLDSYYNEVEKILAVCGDIAADPFIPKDSTGKLFSPHAFSQQGILIDDAGKKLGLNPFPTPLAINANENNGFPACEKLTSCTDYSCPVGAKADSYNRILKPMLKDNKITLFTNTQALKLIQNQNDRVESIECANIKTGERFKLKAKQFVLSCNAIQSSALILRSSNKWWPDGIGNKHDLVGAGLSFKVSEFVSGWVDKHQFEYVKPLLRGLYSTVSITDYYVDDNCPTGLGGLIYETNPWFEVSSENRGVFVQLECILADQPILSNRVRLSDRKNKLGIPLLIIDYKTHEVDSNRLNYMKIRAKEILSAMGAKDISCTPSNYFLGSAHLHGTCRAGVDDKSSVVDKFGRFHSLENLYVADGSFMPFAGGVNPTLTIQANAMRIADNITI